MNICFSLWLCFVTSITSLLIKENTKTKILRSFSIRLRKNHKLIYDFICSNLSTPSHIFFNCNQNRHSSYTVKFINASLTVKMGFESLNACYQKKFNSYKKYLLIPTVFDKDKILNNKSVTESIQRNKCTVKIVNLYEQPILIFLKKI